MIPFAAGGQASARPIMKKEIMSDRIFLLGGHDLEMQTIRELLDKLRIRYADKNLGWGNALLSEYHDILDEYAGKPDCTIYGIELKEDVPPPSNYVRIDHHNDFIDRPSSIEQVLSVLNITPDRHQQLVGANDARYIPGMLALGATRQEVDEIRFHHIGLRSDVRSVTPP